MMTISESLLPKSGPRGGPVERADQKGDPVPTKLSELPQSQPKSRCAGCGVDSDGMRFVASVRKSHQRQALRSDGWDICEKCATQLIFQLQKRLG